MIPEHIIEKSIAGGYKNFPFVLMTKPERVWIDGDNLRAESNDGVWKSQSRLPMKEVLKDWPRIALDPDFWMALGKEMGWGSFYDIEGMPRYKVPAPNGWYPETKANSGYDDQAWEGVALYFASLILRKSSQEEISNYWKNL